MLTVQYDGEPLTEARSHPWTSSRDCSGFRYYDLKAAPEQIRSALEDFTPWAQYEAVEAFYSLLEWLNARDSVFESNDCAFVAPHANENPTFQKRLQCSGRVMVLYRDLFENCTAGRVDWLANALHRELSARDQTFAWGVIGTTTCAVRYLGLPEGSQAGHQLMLSFWIWGDTELEVMENFGRLVGSLTAALQAVSAQLTTRRDS